MIAHVSDTPEKRYINPLIPVAIWPNRIIFPGMATSTAARLESMSNGLETVGGLSRTEIAKRAKISRMSVWRYAVGEGRQPSLETYERLQSLCERVGVDTVTKAGR